MLTPEQRNQLTQVVHEFIGGGPDVASMRVLVGAAGVAEISAVNAYGYASRIVEYALARPSPDTFIEILRQADAGGTIVELQAVVRQLADDPRTWMAHASDNVLFLAANSPFIDRHDLRNTLRAMAIGDGPAAITIEAPTGHGKRTVCDYIERWAAGGNAFSVVCRDLRREPETGTLDLLVADLRLAMDLDIGMDSTHVEPERHGVVLARLLADDAMLASKTVWMVANIVEPSGVEPGVLNFVDELLGCVQAHPLVADRLRVVVLSDDFGRTGLEKLPGIADRHVLPDVTEDEIRQWLEATAPGKAPDLYGVVASRVVRKVADRGPAPSERLQWLARHSLEAHRSLNRMS
jgi:hypothetical protein